MSGHQPIVIGAGPAGIATALALKDVGIRPLVLDAADAVASTWRGRYDRLRLNSSRPLSHLPGRRFARGTPMFPTRDEVVPHLERHAHEGGIDVHLGTRVDRLAREGAGWALSTAGADLRAPSVVVATGYEHDPVIPSWPGRDRFSGEVLHSSAYRRPDPFRGQRVLVVGAGCSGMEIAHDLAEGGAREVWLSARTPPNILLRAGPGGLPGDFLGVALLRLPTRVGDAVARFGRRQDIGDLTAYGLPVPEEGVFSRMRRLGVAPSIVDREVIAAIKARRFTIVAGVERLDETTAHLADDAVVAPDAIVCATGYRRGLEPLVGHLGVLDGRGMPRALGAEPAAPGLRFIGYVARPGSIGYMGRQARAAARAIRRELERPRDRERSAALYRRE